MSSDCICFECVCVTSVTEMIPIPSKSYIWTSEMNGWHVLFRIVTTQIDLKFDIIISSQMLSDRVFPGRKLKIIR